MTQELFQMALNITAPWFVKDLTFNSILYQEKQTTFSKSLFKNS